MRRRWILQVVLSFVLLIGTVPMSGLTAFAQSDNININDNQKNSEVIQESSENESQEAMDTSDSSVQESTMDQESDSESDPLVNTQAIETTMGSFKTKSKVSILTSNTVDTVADLQSAVNGAADGDVITLGSAFPISLTGSIALTPPTGISITIDCQNKTFTSTSNVFTISGNGGLIITKFNISAGTGAISLGTGKVSVTDSTFIGLTGSAISGGNNTDVTIDNCLFKGNKAYCGAAISCAYSCDYKITNSSFIENDGNNGGYNGGAIAVDQRADVNLTISNSYFSGNTMVSSKTGGTGGAIGFYNSSGNLSIDRCAFKANKSTGNFNTADGGAISIKCNNSSLPVSYQLTNSTFDSNQANDDGAAILIEGKLTGDYLLIGKIENNTFYQNHANGFDSVGSGGAIQFYSRSQTALINNTFYKNVKNRGSGGAFGTGGVGAKINYFSNIFLGNIGTGSGDLQQIPSTNTNIINCGGSIIAPESDAASVLGTTTPSLGVNGSDHSAGCNVGAVSPVTVETLYIAPNLGLAGEKYADGLGLNIGTSGSPTAPASDERSITRGSVKDTGAVEIVSARFNANGGKWDASSESAYSYTNPTRYSSYDTNATVAGVAADSGTSLKAPGETKLTNDTKMLLGWSTDPNATVPTYAYTSGSATQVPVNYNSSDVTYYAVWGDSTVTVNYDINGGNGSPSTKPFTETPGTDGKITARDIADFDPNKDPDFTAKWQPVALYEFNGWNTKADGSGISIAIGDSFDLDDLESGATLYAQWKKTAEESDSTDDSRATNTVEPTDNTDPSTNDSADSTDPTSSVTTTESGDSPKTGDVNFLPWRFLAGIALISLCVVLISTRKKRGL